MAIIKNLPATKSLEKQLEYLEQEGKTLDHLRYGINCTNDNITREFNIVKIYITKIKEKHIIILLNHSVLMIILLQKKQ